MDTKSKSLNHNSKKSVVEGSSFQTEEKPFHNDGNSCKDNKVCPTPVRIDLISGRKEYGLLSSVTDDYIILWNRFEGSRVFRTNNIVAIRGKIA